MRPRPSTLPLWLLFVGAGCADSAPPPRDGSATDQGTIGVAESGLFTCQRPGQPCRPADPCGLNPRCGLDRLCHLEGRRYCDDGLACTEDRCIPGGCENRVVPGSCLIDGVCRKAEQLSGQGCGRCVPSISRTGWTPTTGESCNDQNPCTRDDSCRQGICLGELYSCDDGLGCTTDACDGTGRCNHYLKPAHCLIENVCFAAGRTDSSGCLSCAPDVSTKTWTPRKNICTSEGGCISAGSRDPSGCYVCDPASPGGWSPLPDHCDILGQCLPAGTLHQTQCAACAPAKSAQYWSPLQGSALSWTSFSGGLSGYAVTPSVKGVGWQLSGKRFRSPPQSLYYGDPSTGSYDNGEANQGTVSVPLLLPPKQKAYLSVQLYLDVDTADGFDVLSLEVDGQALWIKSAATLGPGDFKRWTPVTVELSAFAGQSVTFGITFKTGDPLKNTGEGVYLDDITLFTGCGPL